jgi:hypothetical protein
MATVKFRIRPKGNPEKETAIHCYYYHEGIEIEKSTGLKVIPANWANSRVTTPKNKINKLLAERESALLNLHIDYTGKSNDELEVMAGSIIKGRPVTKTTEEKKTLIQAVQLFIAQYEREKETGTVKRYKGLLKKLVGFEAGTERNTAPLLFENLDFNFYDAFKKFLYNCYNPVFGMRFLPVVTISFLTLAVIAWVYLMTRFLSTSSILKRFARGLRNAVMRFIHRIKNGRY